jgi:cyanate permease
VQIDAEEDAATDRFVQVPRFYRYVALACVVALPIGTNWTQSSLGPLKNTLRNEWGISNAQFGVVSSADAFVNTVFPILGGMILDWWGPNIVTLCCTTIILVGSLIAAGSTINNMWRLLAGGHVLMGFGIAVLDSAQQKVRIELLSVKNVAQY